MACFWVLVGNSHKEAKVIEIITALLSTLLIFFKEEIKQWIKGRL